jgi:holo-[acyl-carrier protein] synthase
MIVGLGIELVDLARFEALLDRYGDRMRARLFTTSEREYAARKVRGGESLAARFAAKVAARRALRTPALRWQDIEVTGSRTGPPTLRLTGAAGSAARRAGVSNIAVTLTHDATWCVGQVILESGS